jgi:peptide/nickel transport system permease protein
MISYLIRRLLLVVPTLVGMTMLVFFVMALSPGGTGADLAARGEGMRPEERRALQKYLNERYGLDKPLPVQYARWLNRVSPVGFKTDEDGSLGWFAVKWPDLGHSFVLYRPVGDLLAERLPITILLNAISFPIIYTTAVVIGLYAARKRGGLVDVSFGTLLLGLWSVPVIWAGVMVQGFLTSEEYIRWFPTAGLHDVRADEMTFLPQFVNGDFQRGWLLDMLWHLCLPVLCLTYGQFAFLSKLSRGAVLETMTMDFVRTARAKGTAEKVVLYQHVLRNSLIPLITVAAHILPGMIAGSIVVETIFSINGMGSLLVTAVQQRDRELVLSITFVSGLLGLTGYLLADIGYALADPRVTYD